MAQTIGAMSFKDASLEFSVDNGTAWADISGTFTELAVDGGDIPTDDVHSADIVTPIVTEGKANSVELTITSIYSEITAEAQDKIATAFAGRTVIGLRWTAKGNVTGSKLYTALNCRIETLPVPFGPVGDAKAVLIEWKARCPKITTGAVA